MDDLGTRILGNFHMEVILDRASQEDYTARATNNLFMWGKQCHKPAIWEWFLPPINMVIEGWFRALPTASIVRSTQQGMIRVPNSLVEVCPNFDPENPEMGGQPSHRCQQ